MRSLRLAIAVLAWLAAVAQPLRAATVGVVSSDERATAVGLEILAAGGNAVDGAVAAALALAVVFPEAGNLGGGGFAVARRGDEIQALDFREVAPAAASATMYLDENGVARPRASLDGGLAAGVPGSPAGYFELHRRLGRLPWRRVVEPARRLAQEGFAVSARTAQTLASSRDRLARFPHAAAQWLPGGTPIGRDVVVRQPALARTLAEYSEQGPAAITSGRLATAVERASRAAGGVLAAADLAAYRPVWRAPLRFESFGWSFAAVPLPSAGGVLVGETLGVLERLDWRSAPRDSPERTHLLIEALRRAFADRLPLGDPASSRTTPESLLDSSWLATRAGGIDRRRATPSRDVAPGPAADEDERETTNLVVVDATGGVVALTTTLNELYGCAVWVPEAGFFLNDEMDDFTSAPGRPNLYGLVQSDANAIVAGHRPLSSMTPMLLWRGGETVGIGGRGGSRIPSAVVQVLANLWDGDSASAAVARPRLHHQWLPDRIEMEKGALAATVVAELTERGHEVVAAASTAEVNLVHRRADGGLDLGADPRAFESAATRDLSASEDLR